MRLRVAVCFCAFMSVALVVLGQAAPTCADLHVVPALHECVSVQAFPVGKDGARVIPAAGKENQFTGDALQKELSSMDVPALKMSGVVIAFVLSDAAKMRQVMEAHHMQYDPAMHEEGYAIFVEKAPEVIAVSRTDSVAVGPKVVVAAETATGLFYGMQTLKQLIRGRGEKAELLVPTARDWPAMAHRGLSEDWSRGPIPNMEFLKRQIRTLAAYKYNVFSPYFEHTFAYASTPVAAFPGGAMTPEEAKELVDYAALYHIMVVPEQESFGHLHHVLKFEQYSPMGETTHGSVLAPGDATTLPVIGKWFEELAQAFPAPYAHIGADETFELGVGRTREDVTKRGIGPVYIDYLKKIHDTLEPNHKRLLFWGDIAVHSPDLVMTLPKDMIAVPWVYDARPDYIKEIEPFAKAGLEIWVAPGVSNWNRVYPNNHEALGNIRGFVRDGQKLGATGMLNTVWNDDGEGIFDENWFGVLFGAAASWQHGESSEQEFTDSYGLAFHGDQTGKISEAQRELMASHVALQSAGLEDGEDEYFWLDPYSEEGQRVMAKLMKTSSSAVSAVPVSYAAQTRLHAERAIALIAEAKAAGKLENSEALMAMELGARRMDFIGFKFIEADDSARTYKFAQSITGDSSRKREVTNLLYTIGSMNGKIEDMRDSYTQLGQLYSDMWRIDNRPYWLANNELRYQRAAQLWLGRSEHWNTVLNIWWSTHALPPATEAGLCEPVAVQ